MIRRKICMLGSYAVGKTSLVTRFVKDIFSERYRTTIGVRILKKELMVDEDPTTLLLWDLHGEDDFQEIRTSYLRGSSGYLLVVDGTRAATLDKAMAIHGRARESLGDVPFLLLINKSDLRGDWEVEESLDLGLEPHGAVRTTSAKTGAGVEEAFSELARRMAAR
jgi:small GTP-binding protein